MVLKLEAGLGELDIIYMIIFLKECHTKNLLNDVKFHFSTLMQLRKYWRGQRMFTLDKGKKLHMYGLKLHVDRLSFDLYTFIDFFLTILNCK